MVPECHPYTAGTRESLTPCSCRCFSTSPGDKDSLLMDLIVSLAGHTLDTDLKKNPGDH